MRFFTAISGSYTPQSMWMCFVFEGKTFFFINFYFLHVKVSVYFLLIFSFPFVCIHTHDFECPHICVNKTQTPISSACIQNLLGVIQSVLKNADVWLKRKIIIKKRWKKNLIMQIYALYIYVSQVLITLWIGLDNIQ